MTKYILILCVACLTACGVKGPPEPPLPTEASLKKQQIEKEKTKETTPAKKK